MGKVNITFPGNLGQVESVADLRSVPSYFLPDGLIYVVKLAGRSFTFDTSATDADDGQSIVKPNDLTSAQAGRWLYAIDGIAPGPEGKTGPANSSFPSLALMKAAPATNRTYLLAHPDGADGMTDNGLFEYRSGDYTGLADDVVIVKLDDVSLSVGALVRQQASGLAYKLAAIAAQNQLQSEKNEQTLELWEFLTPRMKSDLRSGGRNVDCAPAMQALFNFGQGSQSDGDAVGGRTVHLPSYPILLSSPTRYGIREDQQITDDNNLKRLNIIGPGIANCAFLYNGTPDQPAMTIAGYNSGDGREMYLQMEGFRMQRFPVGQSEKVGVGIRGTHIANMNIEDVMFYGFETNAYLTDVLGFSSDRLYTLASKVGLRTGIIDWTNSNVWKMLNGAISGNLQIGAHFIKAANVFLDTVRMEGNGTGFDSQTVLFEGGSPEGAFSFTMVNGYLENNFVSADVAAAWGFPFNGIISLKGNSFHKTSAARYAKHHIDLSVTAAAMANGNKLDVEHGPNGYKFFGDYVPSVENAVLRIQTPNIRVHESPINQYQSDLERPQSNGFPLIGARYPVLEVNVAANGTWTDNPLINPNVANVVYNGGGSYRIMYKTPPRNPAAVQVNITQTNAFGHSTYTVGSTYVDVLTADANGNSVDRAFSLTVMGDFA